MPGPTLCVLSLLFCALGLLPCPEPVALRPELVEGRAGMRFDKLSAHLPAKEVGHTSCFFASGTRRYVGDRLARCNPQGDAAPVFRHCSRDRRSQCRAGIRSLDAAGWTTTNAPEGGNTTQCGDPAPGPM
jgi:hypothetical protein